MKVHREWMRGYLLGVLLGGCAPATVPTAAPKTSTSFTAPPGICTRVDSAYATYQDSVKRLATCGNNCPATVLGANETSARELMSAWQKNSRGCQRAYPPNFDAHLCGLAKSFRTSKSQRLALCN